MSLHRKLIKIIKEQYEAAPIIGFEVILEDYDFLIRHMFSNYRRADNRETGLHLTPSGHLILSKYFTFWPVKMICHDGWNHRHTLFLDSVARMPYHIGPIARDDKHNQFVTLYMSEGEMALQAKLYGDLDLFRDALS